MENFRRPLYGKSIAEKWNRWHVSLYSWFRDYVYSPLAKKARRSKTKLLAYIVLIFFLSGIWHGANWTYVLWGTFAGISVVIERIYKDTVKPQKYISKKWMTILGTIITFFITTFYCLFFRAQTVSDSFYIAKSIFTFKPGPLFKGSPPINFYYFLLAAGILITVEFFQEYLPHVKLLGNKYVAVRYAGYILILITMLMIGVFNGSQFIYFQF